MACLPEIKSTPPALEGEVLTTGLPRKSHTLILINTQMSHPALRMYEILKVNEIS